MHTAFQKSPRLTAGFTIIEMMVSLALFTIVVTIAVGAFLSLIGGNSKLQGEQAVMSSLTFAMDTMTREIRTGTNYYCTSNTNVSSLSVTAVADCAQGTSTIWFMEAGKSLSGAGTGRISYYYDATDKAIYRRLGVGGTGESIFSSDVTLVSAQFFVSGSAPLSAGANVVQPTVTIILEAQDKSDPSGKIYTLETTITQRQLDL